MQDTLRSKPPETKVMKMANAIATCSSTALYMLCGTFGYAALGNQASGNLLTGFGFYEPFWLIDLANVFIVVHLLGSYQVTKLTNLYTLNSNVNKLTNSNQINTQVIVQPVFQAIESWTATKWPAGFITKEYQINNLGIKINMFRLVWRTVFVVIVTLIAMSLPFFNEILALLGAISYWPLTVYFPVTVYISRNKIKRWTTKWCCLQVLNLVLFLVGVSVAISSVQGMTEALHVYKPFVTKM